MSALCPPDCSSRVSCCCWSCVRFTAVCASETRLLRSSAAFCRVACIVTCAPVHRLCRHDVSAGQGAILGHKPQASGGKTVRPSLQWHTDSFCSAAFASAAWTSPSRRCTVSRCRCRASFSALPMRCRTCTHRAAACLVGCNGLRATNRFHESCSETHAKADCLRVPRGLQPRKIKQARSSTSSGVKRHGLLLPAGGALAAP